MTTPAPGTCPSGADDHLLLGCGGEAGRVSREPSSGADRILASLVDQFEPEHCHELRVRVPTDVHRQLLALKVLRGVTLADAVTLALDRYFAQRSRAPQLEAEPVAQAA